MAPFPNPFRKKPESNPARDAIRGWAEAALGHDPPLTLTISEIDCGDPSCPGLETIILVMREGEATQAVKIRKPMDEIGKADVIEAVQYI